MHKPVSDGRWGSMRALNDGAPYAHSRMSTIGDLNPSTVRDRASRDCWLKVDRRKAIGLWAAGDVVGSLLANALAVIRATPGLSVHDVPHRLAVMVADEDRPDVLVTERPAGIAVDDAISVAADAVDDAASPDDRLVRLSELLSRQATRVLAAAEGTGGILTKAQIDALSALLKLAENVQTLATERAAEKQTRSDAEIAEILHKVDSRVIELAEGHAERLGRRKPQR